MKLLTVILMLLALLLCGAGAVLCIEASDTEDGWLSVVAMIMAGGGICIALVLLNAADSVAEEAQRREATLARMLNRERMNLANLQQKYHRARMELREFRQLN